MSERTWIESYTTAAIPGSNVFSDREVLREILTDENGEPRDGVSYIGGKWVAHKGAVYLVPAEMLEADDG